MASHPALPPGPSSSGSNSTSAAAASARYFGGGVDRLQVPPSPSSSGNDEAETSFLQHQHHQQYQYGGGRGARDNNNSYHSGSTAAPRTTTPSYSSNAELSSGVCRYGKKRIWSEQQFHLLENLFQGSSRSFFRHLLRLLLLLKPFSARRRRPSRDPRREELPGLRGVHGRALRHLVEEEEEERGDTVINTLVMAEV